MPRRLNLPDSASVATTDAQGKLFAPSAARNADAIAALVASFAPKTGRALELASGTGQHVVSLGRMMPDITWQPSEVDPGRRASITSYLQAANRPNLSPPIELDATSSGWGLDHTAQDIILCVNLLHLVSHNEARCLIQEAAIALAPGGVLIIYGPFMRDGVLTSDGDQLFHQSLREKDPEIGYKNDGDVSGWGTNTGLQQAAIVEMPANNLALCWRKPA